MAELNLGHVVGPGVPTGGTSGQILKKNSSTNFDTSWTNNDATTIPMSSSDSTSINEAIANVNDKIKYTNAGIGALSTIESALATIGSGMPNLGSQNVSFTVTSGGSSIFVSSTYYGTIRRDSSGRYNLTAQAMNDSSSDIEGHYSSGSWAWSSIKNDQITALNSVIYNANTDRNVESNRTTVMEYLKSNYFDNKYSRAMVRYASGYYHGYVFVGEYTGSDSLIIEIPHNMNSGEKMIVWRRFSSGEYIKQFSLT